MSDYKDQINDTTKAIHDQGVEAYQKSVYPDSERWIRKNQVAMQGLSATIRQGEQALSGMGTVANTVGSQISNQMQQASQSVTQISQAAFGAVGGTRMANAVELSQRTPINPAAIMQRQQRQSTMPQTITRQTTQSRIASEGRRQGQSGPSVTVNFQGQNIIDESSKNRFARQINRQIQTLSGRSVSVS